MLTPSSWGWVQPSHAVRPVDGYGTLVTPAQNAKGAWVEVMAAGLMTNAGWDLLIRANNADITAATRDMLMDIGIDTGSGFQVLVPDLLVSYAGPYVLGNALSVEYKFPIHIPAGAAIGARASVNSATLTGFNCSVIVSGSPSIPQAVYKGSFVRAYGVVAASSRGTFVTPNVGASKGAWTELGTLADDIRYWQSGWGADDTTLSGNTYHLDVGVGATNPPTLIAIQDQKSTTGTAEQVSRSLGLPAWVVGVNGEKVYARAWCSNAGETNVSMIAYGVGGDGGNVDYPDNYATGYADGYAAGFIAGGGGGGGGPVFPAMSGTTTAPAICEALIAAIKAIIPDSLTGNGFDPHQEQEDFIEWATTIGSACFRRVSVRFNEGAMPLTSGYNYEIRRDPFTILVAYPTNWRAGDSLLDMQRIIDQDRHAIEHVCGWRAGFVNFTVTDDDYDAEYRKVGDTTFLELTFTYEYTRSMV